MSRADRDDRSSAFSEIVLMTADGTNAIMERTGQIRAQAVHVALAGGAKLEEGIDGLLRDKTRPPMATAMEISHTNVQHICAEASLKPHLVRR